MNIPYPHLLFNTYTKRGFVRLLIERIALGERPLLSKVDQNKLYMDGSRTIDLPAASPTDLDHFLHSALKLPPPLNQWNDIRKLSIRNFLLYQYAAENGISFLKMKLHIATKKIDLTQVVMDTRRFAIAHI